MHAMRMCPFINVSRQVRACAHVSVLPLQRCYALVRACGAKMKAIYFSRARALSLSPSLLLLSLSLSL
jgi:hypothetical protein